MAHIGSPSGSTSLEKDVHDDSQGPPLRPLSGESVTPDLTSTLLSTISARGLQRSRYPGLRLEGTIRCAATDLEPDESVSTCLSLETLPPYGASLNERDNVDPDANTRGGLSGLPPAYTLNHD